MDLGDLTFLAGLVQQPIIVEGTPTWVWVASGIAAVLTGIVAISTLWIRLRRKKNESN